MNDRWGTGYFEQLFCRTGSRLLLTSCLLGLSCLPLAAEEENLDLQLTEEDLANFPELAEIEDLPALLKELEQELPSWTRFHTVNVGLGYNDNVLLSNFNAQDSMFTLLGLEFFASQHPTDHGQFDFFISGEDVRYLSDVDVNHEQLVFSQAQYQVSLDDATHVKLPLEYIYQNQVMDFSVTESDVDILKVRGHTLIFHPGVRWQSPTPWWTELQFSLQRQFFDSPLDDYWETGPLMALGRQYGHQSELKFSYEFGVRSYDEDLALDNTGTPIPDSKRGFQKHLTEFKWTHFWDAKRRWRSTTRLSFQHNDDQDSDYFNYDRYRASHQLRYRGDDWTLLGEVRTYEYQYDTQTVSVNNSSNRHRTEFSFRARVEKKFGRHLQAYTEYEYERVSTNIDSEEYDVNTILAGVMFDF